MTKDKRVKLLDTGKLQGQFRITWTLVRRHLKMFFKNKMTFIFSLMVPLLTLLIYALFLRDFEINAVAPYINEYFTSDADKQVIQGMVGGVVDCWMLSGIIAISCITVSLNSCYIIIQDKEQGVNRDFISSPLSKRSIRSSYIIFNFIVTSIICFILLMISLVYLQIVGALYLSFLDFLAIFGTVLLSIISATFFSLFIASFVTNGSVFNSIVAITSAAIGFLIGGYMPLSMLPTYAQYICEFLPGTYSAGALRNLFMRGQMERLTNVIGNLESAKPDAINLIPKLKDQFLNVKFFIWEVNLNYMYLGLVCLTIVIIILHLIFQKYFEIRSIMGKKPKKKKKNKVEQQN